MITVYIKMYIYNALVVYDVIAWSLMHLRHLRGQTTSTTQSPKLLID